MSYDSIKTGNRERGAVMIVALMILLLMTVFGISTMDSNVLEERMAGNMRDRNTAFQAAESALRAAEIWIEGQADLHNMPLRNVSDPADTNPLWDFSAPDPDSSNNVSWWEERDSTWWTGKAVLLNAGDGNDLPGVAAQPGYIIEKMPLSTESLESAQSLDTTDIYLQVTARGVGGSDSTVVVLQSVYKW